MRFCLIALSIGVLCGCSSAPPEAENARADKVRELVALQGTAELNAWRAAHEAVEPQNVRIVGTVPVDGGGTVWRAVLPHYHFHPFTVLEKDGELIELGGFGGVEMERAAELLRLRPAGDDAAREAARTLALLADPNGAERYVIIGAPATRDTLVLRSWRKNAVEAFRPDTVLRLQSGDWMTRVTVLSQQTRSYGQAWQPYTYSFIFSPDHGLKSWFVRSGRPFQLGSSAEGSPVAAVGDGAEGRGGTMR